MLSVPLSDRKRQSIFCYTEAVTERPRIREIEKECDELRSGLAGALKSVQSEAQLSLQEFDSTRKELGQAHLHRWRNHPGYSTTRNRILTILSGIEKTPDKEEEDAFSQLLFPHKGRKPARAENFRQFKFAVPEILSPRMTHFMHVNRRSFGSNFKPLVSTNQPAANEDWSPDFLAQYLQEEIGKYNVSRFDRLIRVPHKAAEGRTKEEAAPDEVIDGKVDPLSLFLFKRKRLPTFIRQKYAGSDVPMPGPEHLISPRAISPSLKLRKPDQLQAGTGS